MNNIDLTEFTFFLLAIAVFVPIQINASNRKKTWQIRGAIIAAVFLLYVIVVGINLRPIPANGDTTVYITSTGSKYHSESCYHLFQSKIETTLVEAIADGYSVCAHCSAPDYIPETITPKFADLYSENDIKIIITVVAIFVVFYGGMFLSVIISEHIKERKRIKALIESDQKAKTLCTYMWDLAIQFSKSIGFGDNSIFIVNIWTCLYSIAICSAEIQNISWLLYKHMTSTMPVYLKKTAHPINNAEAEHLHQIMLKPLQSEEFELSNRSDIRNALDLIHCYSVSEQSDLQKPFYIDSKEATAFYNTTLLLRTFISELYPDKR